MVKGRIEPKNFLDGLDVRTLDTHSAWLLKMHDSSSISLWILNMFLCFLLAQRISLQQCFWNSNFYPLIFVLFFILGAKRMFFQPSKCTPISFVISPCKWVLSVLFITIQILFSFHKNLYHTIYYFLCVISFSILGLSIIHLLHLLWLSSISTHSLDVLQFLVWFIFPGGFFFFNSC